MTGLPFDLEAEKICWNSPSFDRIKAGGGYVRGNVRLVLFAMNAALGNWGEKQLREIMGAWLNGKA